ncbi:Uncharacterised protein [Vibrio cholerae]|nr:Uncharacterised protein [Vibrio cholerae]CSI47868.1 Uncharacterised protein [Vibrio cholerae]
MTGIPCKENPVIDAVMFCYRFFHGKLREPDHFFKTQLMRCHCPVNFGDSLL